jgi:hypothetical protein
VRAATGVAALRLPIAPLPSGGAGEAVVTGRQGREDRIEPPRHRAITADHQAAAALEAEDAAAGSDIEIVDAFGLERGRTPDVAASRSTIAPSTSWATHACPSRCRRRTISAPIRPRPITPICMTCYPFNDLYNARPGLDAGSMLVLPRKMQPRQRGAGFAASPSPGFHAPTSCTQSCVPSRAGDALIRSATASPIVSFPIRLKCLKSTGP